MTTAAWSFYDPDTGEIASVRAVGDADAIAAACPPGMRPIKGALDHMSQRVDIVTGQVLDWKPPAPPDSALVSWRWDSDVRRWVPEPTQQAHRCDAARDARAERDRRLAACDWTQLPDVSQSTRAAWQPYRQALRDVTGQPGWPHDITWPAPPA